MILSKTELSFFAGGCVTFGALVTGGVIWWVHKKNINKSITTFDCKGNWPYNAVSQNLHAQRIHVITSSDEFDALTPLIEADLIQIKLLGFDCEWSSSSDGYQPVSLLQLSTVSGLCILIRIRQLQGKLPLSIVEILKSSDILKVGVGIYDDARKLLTDYGLAVSGCVDLRNLVTQNNQLVPQSLSLKGLAATYLNVALEKSKRIQCSFWDADVLSEKQVWYAANDAHIAVRLFSKMMIEKFECSIDLNQSVRFALLDTLWATACGYCQELKDIKFRNKGRRKTNNETKKQIRNKPFKSYSTRQNHHHLNDPMIEKLTFEVVLLVSNEEIELVASDQFPNKKFPLYDNCKLEAPDGQLLSTCDRKKANWYIEKELADLICEEPFTIRLRFEPAGRPTPNRDYYLFDKENVCVVCGHSGAIIRKNVVPHEYRKHFPLVLKDHVSHDIVPLCVPCHQRAAYHDQILRSKIAEEYEAPLGSLQSVQLLEDPERRGVRSAGRALAKAGDKIPQPRKCKLENIIVKYFGAEAISNDLINEASVLETRYKNESYVGHGEKVVSTIFKTKKLLGLIDFERQWREHFLLMMQPKHMPQLWSVDHNHDKILPQDLDNV